MRRSIAWAVVCVALFPALAVAEATLPHLGRLLGPDDRPVTGTKQLTFALYYTASGGEAVWSETRSVLLDATGAYTVQLGETTPLAWSVFAEGDGALFLGISVEGEPMEPRLRVGRVPTAHVALQARTADNVDCEGCVLPAALSGGITPDKLEPIPPSLIDGLIPATKIEGLPIEQVTGDVPTTRLGGLVTADQLAPVPVAKLDGTIPPELLDPVPASKLEGPIPLSKVEPITSSSISGTIPDAKVESLSAAKLTGTVPVSVLPTVPGSQLVPGSVTGEQVGDASLSPAKLSAAACSPGQVLKASGASFTCAADEGTSYAAGSGVSISGGTIAIAPGGVGAGHLAPGSVGSDAFAPECAEGQVWKRGTAGWQCASDNVGSSGTGGLLEVTVQAPLSGTGTSASPLGVADGGVTGAMLATGAVGYRQLAPTMSRFTMTAFDRVMPTCQANWREAAVSVAAGAAGLCLLNLRTGALSFAAYPYTEAGLRPLIDGLGLGVSSFAVGTIGAAAARVPDSSARALFAAAGLSTLVQNDVDVLVAVHALGRQWTETVRSGPPSVQVSGVVVDGLALVAASNADLQVVQQSSIELGANVAGKEPNAGRITYQRFTADALEVVGAGTSHTNRKVQVFAEGGTHFTGPITLGSALQGLRPQGSDLRIENGGTVNQRINVVAPAGTFVHCPWGWASFARGKVCMELELQPAALMSGAIRQCSSRGARVCGLSDYMTACQFGASAGEGVQDPFRSWAFDGAGAVVNLNGFNPFGGQARGWLGDPQVVPVASSFSVPGYATWGKATCDVEPLTAAVPQGATLTLPYRCCQ